LDAVKDKAQATWLAAERTLHDASKLQDAFEAFDKVKEREAELQGQAAQRQLDRTQALQAHAAQKIMPVFGRITEAEQALGNTNEEISAADSMLATTEETRAVAEAVYATEKNRHEERAAAVAKVHELNSYAGKAEQLVTAKTAQDVALASETGRKSIRDSCVQTLEAHLSGEADIQQQLESLQKSISSAEGIDLKVHKLTAAVRSRKQLATLDANLGDAEQGLGKEVRLFAAAESAKESADITLKRLRKTWHQGQAALLAQELEEGNACPVCGSADHPAPALESVQIVSDDQLEEAATALDLHTSQVMAASGHVTACEQRVGSIKTEIKQCIDNLGDQAQQSVAAIEANFREASAVAGQLLVDQNRIKALQQTLKTHAEKTIALRKAVDAAQAAIAGAQKELGESQARFVLSENALPKPYRAVGKLEQELAAAIAVQTKLEGSLDQAQTRFQQADIARAGALVSIKELQRNKTKNEQVLSNATLDWAQALTASVFNTEQEVQLAAMAQHELDTLDETLAKYAAEVLENKATGETLEKQLKGKVLADLPGLKEVEESAISGRDETLEAWRAADRTMTRLYDTRKSLKSKQAQMADLDAKYRVVGTLADVACGLKGSKVSLQRYILGVLLDDVLVQSTQRLLKMSDGRYELRRKLDQGKGNKASGLDLEVYDDYSGESRSVATLSGGESFMAALSLALGLSDVVQAQTGGIALDTLFVDEGFGTLDSDALELAVSTLMDLQQAGRMVGIISHVSELKEQMDIRIDLSKSSQGVSSLKVVSPMLGGGG
jgi:exonuclease SbcC